MTIWRMSNHLTLDGGGGLRAPNRWHTRGRRIVYCAPNPATALLEILVHNEVEVGDIPVSYQYLEIAVPEPIASEKLESSILAQNWKTDVAATRRLGDEWLDSGRTALLLIPCVIVPETWNVLINPRHADSSLISIQRIHQQPVDPRLWH